MCTKRRKLFDLHLRCAAESYLGLKTLIWNGVMYQGTFSFD